MYLEKEKKKLRPQPRELFSFSAAFKVSTSRTKVKTTHSKGDTDGPPELPLFQSRLGNLT